MHRVVTFSLTRSLASPHSTTASPTHTTIAALKVKQPLQPLLPSHPPSPQNIISHPSLFPRSPSSAPHLPPPPARAPPPPCCSEASHLKAEHHKQTSLRANDSPAAERLFFTFSQSSQRITSEIKMITYRR